ncbi:MAG TPA: hypothetical protein VIF81_05580 [Pyrinomonadaceae bacterium]
MKNVLTSWSAREQIISDHHAINQTRKGRTMAVASLDGNAPSLAVGLLPR